MKNTRRLQAKVQHMALASIIIAGIVAPVTQLTTVFPGMSLQDVKAATTGTPDAETKAGVSYVNQRDNGAGDLGPALPTQLAGASGSVDGSWGLTPAATSMYAKGDFLLRYASINKSGDNQLFNGGQAKNTDTSVTPPDIMQNSVTDQSATYMAASPAIYPTNSSYYNQAVAVLVGTKGSWGTSGTPTKISDDKKVYRFKGPQYAYLHNPADTTGTQFTSIKGLFNTSYGPYVTVTFADGTQADASASSSKYSVSAFRYYYLDANTGAVMVQTGTLSGSKVIWSAGHIASSDADFTNNAGSPVASIKINGTTVQSPTSYKSIGWQMVVTGQVKMPNNGDTTAAAGEYRMFASGGVNNAGATVGGASAVVLPLSYSYDGGNAVNAAYDGKSAYRQTYQEAGFNILAETKKDLGTITHDESYTDANGKSVTTGSYTGSQLVQLDKFTNTQSSDTTGTYTIDTGSSSVGFASDAIVLQNKNGDDVSAAVNMSGVTYKDATGATVTDSSKAKTATLTATLPAGASFTVKSKLVANAGQPAGVTSTTTMAGKDANGDAVNLAGTFNWVPVTTVSGNITYVDATGATVATGKYADKQPGASTSDITAPITTDGYRYKFVSADKATYDGSDIKVTVAKIATGNINYVYNGKAVSSTPFTDQDSGKTIANIAAPAGTVDGLRYKLADATKSYAYPDKDGDVNVDLAAIVSGTIEFVDADNNNALVKQQAFTDQTPGEQISPLTLPDGYVLAVDANGDVQSTYNYPTTDAQVVTVKVQKLTTGNRNDGMELTEVPSFSSDNNTIGASDTTTLTATKDGVLSYLNLKGQKADIYMSATDLKSNGSALPIKTLKANLSAGLADVYAANQTDGYGHMIVNDTTSKKGSLTIPDLQMTLSNNNFAAGTYSGTINYTMVSDDLN